MSSILSRAKVAAKVMLVGLVAVGLVGGCAKKEEEQKKVRAPGTMGSEHSVDDSGHCTTAFMNDRMAITQAYNDTNTKRANSTMYYSRVKEACAHFERNHAGAVCIASFNGVVSKLSAKDVKYSCDVINRAGNGGPNPGFVGNEIEFATE